MKPTTYRLEHPKESCRLRIQHVIGSFQVGGAERHALQLAIHQANSGHEVSVVGLAPGPLFDEFAHRGASLSLEAKRGRLDPTLPPRLALLFARNRVDVVHTHNPPPLVYGSVAARGVGALLVHSKHGVNHDIARRVWLRKTAGRLVHALVAVSEDTARTAIDQQEAPADRVHVIRNGIDVDAYRPSRKTRAATRAKLGISRGDRVIGSIGRLVPEKNHELLLRACAPVLRDGRTQLVLVGDGPGMKGLLALSSELGIARQVHLLGTRMDTPALLACMDLFVLSSRTEGLPLALLEAMAAELPVVATRVGGIPNVMEGQQIGSLVASGDEDAMRLAIRRLLDAPDRARQLGRRARRLVTDHFGLDFVADETMALYERLLGRSRPVKPPRLRSVVNDYAA